MFKPYNVGKLRDDWELNKRWQGIKRPYAAEDVVRLRGTVQIEHTLARMGAEIDVQGGVATVTGVPSLRGAPVMV